MRVHNARMTSRGSRHLAAGCVAVLALTLGLSGCGGGDGGDGAKPTVTAGVTLTPGGKELAFGKAANFAWAPDQNTKGLVSVSVDSIVKGSSADVDRIQITPKPAKPHLYYVSATVKNLGKVDLGGRNAANLPLYLDEGTDMLNRAAVLAANMQFAQCPPSVLPTPFPKGAEAKVCLVYVPGNDIDEMVLQPAAGDSITWKGTVTTPSPTPTPSKAGKKKKPAAAPTASAKG